MSCLSGRLEGEDWREGDRSFLHISQEEIFYTFDIPPVRIMGSHEILDVSEPHLCAMFGPFCRDVLAQGLL
ncbi:MAG: hypothetical protein SV375_02540 [Thermodesulfobacteriota bacterium]|nr:hypothetical protein [Thermodesulfobacteriota bacterium]